MPFFQDRGIEYFAHFDIESFKANYQTVLEYLNDLSDLSKTILKSGTLLQCNACCKSINISYKDARKEVKIHGVDHTRCKQHLKELEANQVAARQRQTQEQDALGSDVDHVTQSNRPDAQFSKHARNAAKITTDNEDLLNEIKRLKECNDGLTKKLQEKERDIETHRNDLERLKTEIDQERFDMGMTQSEWSAEIERKGHEVKKLSTEINQYKRNITKLENEKAGWKRKYETEEPALNKENEDLSLELECVKAELKSRDAREDYLKHELKTLQSIIDKERLDSRSTTVSLETRIKEMESRLRKITEKKKKFLTVNLHTSLKNSLSQPAQTHIETCLREKLNAEKIDLEVRRYDSPDVTPGPVLVLCMNVSRLGTDVKEAMKGTPGNQDVIVVVLHHKEVHALPKQSSDRVLTGDEYKQLGAIVDAAFWSGKGMYPCPLNTMAIDKIYHFLLRFAIEHSV